MGMIFTKNITLTERHDPNEFFQTRSGLYVWPKFRSRVVANAKPMEASSKFKLEHALLTQNMTDQEIEKALPKNHLFDDGVACAIIATLIAKQPNGEEGLLLNSGYSNLFYLSSCVVFVFWFVDRRLWYVYAWDRGGCEWSAGVQVFSLATTA